MLAHPVHAIPVAHVEVAVLEAAQHKAVFPRLVAVGAEPFVGEEFKGCHRLFLLIVFFLAFFEYDTESGVYQYPQQQPMPEVAKEKLADVLNYFHHLSSFINFEKRL